MHTRLTARSYHFIRWQWSNHLCNISTKLLTTGQVDLACWDHVVGRRSSFHLDVFAEVSFLCDLKFQHPPSLVWCWGERVCLLLRLNCFVHRLVLCWTGCWSSVKMCFRCPTDSLCEISISVLGLLRGLCCRCIVIKSSSKSSCSCFCCHVRLTSVVMSWRSVLRIGKPYSRHTGRKVTGCFESRRSSTDIMASRIARFLVYPWWMDERISSNA